MRLGYAVSKIKSGNRIKTLTLSLIILLLLPVSGPAREMDDLRISYAVENQLLSEQAVPALSLIHISEPTRPY